MTRLTAVCGLDCAACDGFKATQANDQSAKEATAAKWRTEYGNPKVDAAYVTCDGCLSTGRLGGHCLECRIRTCGLSHEVPNCAHCADYSSCTPLREFLDYAPYLRPVLDDIRASL